MNYIYKIIFQVILKDFHDNEYSFTKDVWLSSDLGLSVVIERGKCIISIYNGI